jgi:arylsulfatase A-like enzyme
MKLKAVSFVLLTLVALVVLKTGAFATFADKRPNILLIVADDLGYTDLGSFGSDIQTPKLDALAAEGILFTQFHTAVMCAPTRAMLLSGNNNHVAGMARQATEGILDQPHPGYENHLSNRVVPFPRLLQESGYHTYISGKWHLGLEEESEHSPFAVGFERSFTNLGGGGNHWSALGWSEGGSTYQEDKEMVEWPEGRYSTDLYTERLIEFIDSNRDDGKPFFALATYTSPHWPLQVPEVELDRYAGLYDRGYDQLRKKNFESLKSAGIIPPSSTLPPRNVAVTPWEELDAEQQRRESRKMELYAAMVSNLDHHVGRLVEYLKAQALYDNTLIVFMSDNGAAAEDFFGDPTWEEYYEYTRANYNNTFENMGKPGSFVSYGIPWAEAGSAPFQRHKGYTREGGITAPMIIAGKGVAIGGVKSSAYLTVMDLAPTFLELAGADYPAGGIVQPMRGASIKDFLMGRSNIVHDDNYVTVHSHGGRSLIRKGSWKLTNLDRPFDEAEFELFNLELDPGETTNLADSEPDKFQEMLELWRVERKALGIVLPQDL